MSDLLLLLSEKESFGLVLLEAMFCGVVCIGTNAGGIPEVIQDGETGFICKVGDVQDIAEKALRVLTNPALHAEMVTRSMDMAKERFRSNHIVSQYEDLYYKLLGTERNATV